MAEEIQNNLESYHLQLQQVDAALTSSPDNEELLKLKKDLEEVIELTKELLTGGVGEDDDLPLLQDGPSDWHVGDKCVAPWSEDGKVYEAVIEELHPDGKASIGFTDYAHGEVIDVSVLRPIGSKKRKLSTAHHASSDSASTSAAGKRSAPKETIAERKQALLKHKEYLKKRKQKKLARVEEQEKEREKDKKKWLNFSTKKGLMNKKKSIFASPETVDGRVGIGTCGVSGKPMTESAPMPIRNTTRTGKFRSNYK